MSNYPNWEMAPEGATHFHYGNVKHSPHWRKRGYYCVTDFEHLGWRGDSDPLPVTDYVERPQPEPKPWSGPEDGLPPVGSTVQVWDKEPHKCYAHHCGNNVTILAHRVGKYGEPVAVYHAIGLNGFDEYHALIEDCFRPIQPLQDQRETAIRDVMDIAQVDCRVTAARLVDAGFKLPSKSESRDNAVDAMELIVPHIGSVAAGKLYDAGFKREVV